MAITILQEPTTPGPVFNDQNWMVSSNNTAQPNFQFIAEVYSAGGTLLCKLKRPIETGTTKGWFSLGRIIEAYLSYNFAYNEIVSSQNLSSYYRYYIKFGEEYGSTVTEYLNLATGTTTFVWNAALKTYEFPAFSISSWQYDNGSTGVGRFLTPIRSNYPTTLNQWGHLWLLQKPSAPPDRVKVVAYDSAGATTTSYFATGLTTNDPAYTLIRIPAHPENLNGIVTLVSGTPGSVIPSTTVYYTLQMYNSAAPALTGEVMRFDVNCESNFTTPVVLYWMNRYGGFDSFVFDGQNQYKSDTQRKAYRRNQRAISGNNYLYSADGLGMVNHFTEVSESVQLTTRWLNSTEMELLDQLATSPLVYMLKDGVVTGMTVTGTAHNKKTGEEFEAVQYDFELAYALKDFAQRF
jgi:hypothetical protein